MKICDLRYRGNNYEGKCNIQIVNRFRKWVSHSLCRWWTRCFAIESVIGHCQRKHRMDRNQIGRRIVYDLYCRRIQLKKQLRAFPLFLYLFFRLVFFQLGKYSLKEFGNVKIARRKIYLLSQIFLKYICNWFTDPKREAKVVNEFQLIILTIWRSIANLYSLLKLNFWPHSQYSISTWYIRQWIVSALCSSTDFHLYITFVQSG